MDARRDKEVADGRFLRGAPAAGRLRKHWLRVCIGAAALLFLLLPLAGENGIGAFLQLRAERDRLRAEVAALAHEKALLQSRIDELRDDPAALERLARERFNMRRPDEQVLIIVPPEQHADRSP